MQIYPLIVNSLNGMPFISAHTFLRFAPIFLSRLTRGLHLFFKDSGNNKAQPAEFSCDFARPKTAPHAKCTLGNAPKTRLEIFSPFYRRPKRKISKSSIRASAQNVKSLKAPFGQALKTRNLQKLHSAKVPKHKNSKISIRLKCRKKKNAQVCVRAVVHSVKNAFFQFGHAPKRQKMCRSGFGRRSKRGFEVRALCMHRSCLSLPCDFSCHSLT